jgi:hypothetical protein
MSSPELIIIVLHSVAENKVKIIVIAEERYSGSGALSYIVMGNVTILSPADGSGQACFMNI